jgi:hypothetical protein
MKKFHGVTLHRQRLYSEPTLRKLITRSQYLRRLGIKLELRWVPRHSRIKGNERADADRFVSLDEGLQLINPKPYEDKSVDRTEGDQNNDSLEEADCIAQ